MSTADKSSRTAHIAGAYEHPTREAPDKSAARLHAEAAKGALDDAGIDKSAIDGYMTAGAPGNLQLLTMADYLGLSDLSLFDSTDIGGSAYLSHVGHAASAIATGKCDSVLVTLANRPRSGGSTTDTEGALERAPFEASFEALHGTTAAGVYAIAARRHMHEFGTTEEQLAAIRVAASHHAQFNENAMYRDRVSVEEVMASRYISDPLKLYDCCVISDGAGAVIVTSRDVAANLDREAPVVLGHGEAIKHHEAGAIDLTYTGAKSSGQRAYDEAGIGPNEVDVVNIYDSFTITALQTIEDLGFCAKGDGGSFVEGGALQAPDGELPFNTDGGSLCSNHPDRGGMTKIIETVRQLRGEANEPVQVPNCRIGLAHGTGGGLATRMGSSTLILGEEGYR